MIWTNNNISVILTIVFLKVLVIYSLMIIKGTMFNGNGSYFFSLKHSTKNNPETYKTVLKTELTNQLVEMT